MTEAPAGSGLDWAAVKTLYGIVMSLPPAERDDALACATADDAVRHEVRSLLDHAPEPTGQAASFLARPAVADLWDEPAPVRIGTSLGRWEIVRPLGSGGMGDVFEARRADGAYEGRAAVKLLKRGMDSEAVLQRFSQERQALARLQHPNIAALIDAGVSRDGLPYFVMAYVEGRPIDDAVRGWSLDERLTLFLQLADAVAHAHRNLLVHRDLKPGNVLVTADRQVMLLDFGIAKALDPHAAATGGVDTSNRTLAAERLYTPHHASPEQVRGDAVTTATDVYSLGALLYQMLTGARPTGRTAVTPADAARCVLEEAPLRPSAVVPDATGDPQWPAVRKRLVGDLDNILLKALAKPIAQRYSSVEAMAEDVRAFQGGFPVSARAPSRRYLLGKLVGRHRGVTVALALAVTSMVLGLGISVHQTVRADAARDDAQRQLADLKRVTSELVFRFGDAITAMPGGTAAQEALLDQTITSLDRALQRTPDDGDLRALTSAALGRLAQLQGNPTLATADRNAVAQATVSRALSLAEPIWASRRGDWQFAQWHLITLITQAHLRRAQGRLRDALPVLDLAVARAGEALATALPDVGRAYILEARGVALQTAATMYQSLTKPSLRRPADALRYYDAAEFDVDALRHSTALLAAMDRDAVPGEPAAHEYSTDALAALQMGRAMCRYQLDDLDGARRDAERARDVADENLRIDPTDVLWRNRSMQIQNVLATVLNRLGDAEGALRAADAATALAKGIAESNHGSAKAQTQLATVGVQRARALAALGRHAEALALYRAAAQAPRDAGPQEAGVADDGQLQAARLGLDRATSLFAVGQSAEAESLLRGLQAPLDRLVADTASHRDALLLRAGVAVVLADHAGPDASQRWRAQARDDLQRAAALQPLAADHARLLGRLS